MKKIFSFLKSLSRHNDREWFSAHKPLYLEAKGLADALASRLIALVAEVDPEAARFGVKDVTYRIYRDTRFSGDKTPYKTHIGIFINPPAGKKSLRYGYYFHLEPGNSLIAAGNMPGPTALTNLIRRDIFDNIDEWLEIVESPEFAAYFPHVGSDPLVNAPKGFPKEWPYIEYLKPRNFGTEMPVSDDFFDSDGLEERLRPIIAQMKRLNDFVNYSVDNFVEQSDSF